MHMLKILICDENYGVMKEYERFFKDKPVDFYTCPKNGLVLLDNINNLKPDIVITDIFLSHIDGLRVAQCVAERDFRPSLLMAMSPVDSENIINMAIASGFDYFFLKPCSPDNVYNKILIMLNMEKSIPGESRVALLLHNMNMPAHLQGYKYIKTAVEQVISQPSLLNGITTELYPMVARVYTTTAKRVERSIRTAVEITWLKGNRDMLKEMFPYHRNNFTRPSNSEFISTAAEYIKLYAKDKHSFTR